MSDLGGLADQGTPLMNDLGQGASALGHQFKNLTPFASAARTSLIALGKSAAQSQSALIATEPLAQRLLRLGNASVPAFSSLDQLTSSLDKTGAIEQLMGLLFNGTSAGNGFDSIGHFLRTELEAGSCTAYAPTPLAGCSANFSGAHAASVRPAARASARRVNGAKAASPPSALTNLVLQAARAAPPRVHSAAPLKSLLDYLIGNGR
jgi:hypothetical protein